VSECDFETLTMWRLGPNGTVAPQKRIKLLIVIISKSVLSIIYIILIVPKVGR